jgi:carotenoid cleavage dioxygenase
MAITPNYSILHDLPLFYDMEALKAGRHKIKFHAEMPARFAVVPRFGQPGDIRWFDAAPCYLYHVSNAWEEGDEVVMTGTPFRTPRDRDGRIVADALPPLLATLDADYVFYEWRFNLQTGKTRERILDDVVNTEFPVVNSARQGEKTRYSWNILMARNRVPEQPRFCGLTRFDLQTGRVQAYSDGPECWYNEAPFAPKDRMVEEDDGYLVGFVWNAREQRSEVQVWDAKDIGEGPVARVPLPVRVPHGFHSTWVSAARLKSGR